MTQFMPVLPDSAEIRRTVERRLAVAKQGDGEKLTVEWRGNPIHCHVISMDVNHLKYNPDTHRIRAQRTMDPERNQRLLADPWSEEAQAYLHELLRAKPSEPSKVDPDYIELKENLEDHGQLQPGLITPDGVLVNGNTRCAALRDIGYQHIRVAVLPNDATWNDVSEVELGLQLRKDYRRDYSYINRLIAIDEQIERGRPLDDVAKAFHSRRSTIEQDRWIFNLITEAIERSSDEDGNKLRLVDFEDHQEKLKELQRAYKSEFAKNADNAELLKEARLVAIVLGFSKTDIRFIGHDFAKKYLNPALPQNLIPEEDIDDTDIGGVSIPGLDIKVPGKSSEVRASRALTDTVLTSKVKASDENLFTDQKTKEANDKISQLTMSADEAIRIAGRDERLRKREVVASERISDATEGIKAATTAVAESLATGAVDEGALDDALLDLRNELIGLSRQIRRATNGEGAGLAWIIAISNETE